MVHREESWSWGRKTHEQREDGSFESWYDDGSLRREGSFKKGNGWTRHYREDSTLTAEEHWLNGVKVEPDAGLPPPLK